MPCTSQHPRFLIHSMGMIAVVLGWGVYSPPLLFLVFVSIALTLAYFPSQVIDRLNLDIVVLFLRSW